MKLTYTHKRLSDNEKDAKKARETVGRGGFSVNGQKRLPYGFDRLSRMIRRIQPCSELG